MPQKYDQLSVGVSGGVCTSGGPAPLTRLGSLGASEILTSMTELVMNKDLKHEWLLHTEDVSATPPVERLLAFLRKKADRAENEESTISKPISSDNNRSNQTRNRGNSKPPLESTSISAATSGSNSAPRQPTRVAASQPANEYHQCRYSCPLCSENHYPYHCRLILQHNEIIILNLILFASIV